jgi:siderophore synthetase component
VTIQFQPGASIAHREKITAGSLIAAGRRVIAQTLGAFLTERLLPDHVVRTAPSPGRAGEVLVQTADPAISYGVHVKRTIAYDRWLVDENSIWRQVGADRAGFDDPLCFLDDLLPLLVGDDTTHARFRDEINRTVLNHAQSLESGREQPQPLAALTYDFAEAHLTDGHRYHPCFKSRIGFTPRENRAYGPEFANNLKPVWLAVHRDLANSASLAFPEGQDSSLLTAADAPPLEEGYHILPVHPWQWEREIEAATIVERASGRISFLGETSHEYLAQQSIRTLADTTYADAPTLKLALSIRNTSTTRTLASHTVLNAPIISKWLHEVSQDDPYLSEAGTIFLLERMGTTVSLPRQQDPHGAWRGGMASIWRDPVHKYLDAKIEQASPFSMLTHLDFDGQPAIRQWLDAYGVENWTRALLKAAAIPVVHLLACCGIALESHQQNMLLIHRNGWPSRVALKTFTMVCVSFHNCFEHLFPLSFRHHQNMPG